MYLHDLRRLKCVLTNSPTLLEIYDSTSGEDIEDYITFFAIDMDLLQTGKPCIMISHDGGWVRNIQAMGSDAYITDSRIVIHFEQLIDSESNETIDKIMTDFVTWCSKVVRDCEKIRDPYMILSHAPETSDTPSITPLTEIESNAVSFRVSLAGR